MQTTVNASASPDAARLALKLVEWNYGGLCKDVIQVLLKHGRQTFQELRYLSKLPTEALRTALVVLIQQNCVAVYTHMSDLDRKAEQLYEADMPRMLQIVRMPRFLEAVRTDFSEETESGEVAIAVFQTLLHHGRLRLSQLPHAVRSSREAAGLEGDVSPQTMLAAVQALLKYRYIERVPPCTLPPPPTLTHDNYKKKRAAQPKQGSEEEAQMHREAAKAKLRSDFQDLRFNPGWELNVQTFTLPAPAEEEDQAAQGGRRDKKRAASVSASSAGPAAKKSKVEVKKEDGTVAGTSATAAEASDDVILWRVNYDEFNRKFRNEAIVKLISEQFKTRDEVALTMEALLSLAGDNELDPSTRISTFVTRDEIVRESRNIHGDGAVNPAKVRNALEELVSAELARVDEGQTRIGADISIALATVRKGHILSVIKNRFGDTARRIWNMLAMESQLEQKTIAEKAMVPNAEAREALYAMLKGGYLGLQDIPRNNDRAPSKTFYTWRASVNAASSRLASELYRSAANVVARLHAELKEKETLMEMVQLVGEGSMSFEQLDQKGLHRVKGVTRNMQIALLRLDEQIALFNDF